MEKINWLGLAKSSCMESGEYTTELALISIAESLAKIAEIITPELLVHIDKFLTHMENPIIQIVTPTFEELKERRTM